MSNELIGYMSYYLTSTGGYAGGLMVCDHRGFPEEFRYSEPVKPTKVQQVLFGNVLDKYLMLDVIADNLVKTITSSFKVLIIDNEVLFENKLSSNFTVVKVFSTKSSPLSNPGDQMKIKDREYLIQTQPNTSPIRIIFSNNYDIEEPLIQKTLETLVKMSTTMDVAEPISRVTRALELICHQTRKQD